MEKYLYIVCLVWALTACSKQESTQGEQTPVDVKTMVIAPQPSGAVSRYVGTIEPARTTPLSMQTAGRVVEIAVKNGQRVSKGQTIVSVDNTQALNTLRTAEASLTHARDGYDRVSKVHDKGVVSDQKMVEIESQLAQAQSLYEAAKQQLNECTLVAPCDGVVDGLQLEIGQTVLPGTKLCAVLDLSAFSVRFSVPDAEMNPLKNERGRVQGMVEINAVHAAYPITVMETGISANALTHTYDVVADVKGGQGVLMNGMVGVVKLQGNQGEADSESIVIPARCVLLKPEGATVWVMEDGKAVRRLITVDGYQADGVRVAQGLSAGDILITEGYQKLYEGCKLNTEN